MIFWMYWDNVINKNFTCVFIFSYFVINAAARNMKTPCVAHTTGEFRGRRCSTQTAQGQDPAPPHPGAQHSHQDTRTSFLGLAERVSEW